MLNSYSKKLVILLLILFSSNAYSDLSDYVPEDIESNNFVYIDSVDMIDSLDTVTYIVSNDDVDPSMARDFYGFSDFIGLNNGAIILSKKQGGVSSYLGKSECRVLPSEGYDLIIFEDRINKKCFSYHVKDYILFSQTIADIGKYLNGENKNLNDFSLENKANTIVDENLKGTLYEGLIYPIKELVRYLINF